MRATRASHPGLFKCSKKNLQNSQKNTCSRVSLCVKLHAVGFAKFFKMAMPLQAKKYLRHISCYEVQIVRNNQSFICLPHIFNISTDATVILNWKMLNKMFAKLFKIWNQWNSKITRKSLAKRLQSTNKIILTWLKNTHVVSNFYSWISQRVSSDKIFFLIKEKFQKQ